jgi:hypothetical protein
VLQKEVAVEHGLRKLQDDVAEAQKQVPQVPAIVARLDAEQNSVRRELEATAKKVSRLRVDQSLADYSISQLRKDAEASKAASIEMETSTSRFVMRNIDPVAARTLRDFAARSGLVVLSGGHCMMERHDEPRATRSDTELATALRALRVAELRLLGAWTAAVWGRAQSAPHEQILSEASRLADADARWAATLRGSI